MSQIKLPVRVYKVDQEAWDCEFLRIIDAEGHDLTKDQVAAALNAAPKRAFAELTADGVGLILQNVLIEIGEPPDNGAERQEWLKRHDATVLAHLQAFAAPVAPAWQPIETAPRDGTAFDAWTRWGRVTNCVRCAQWGRVYAYREEDAGYSYLIDATHWMPLPAAPEAQGGADHG